MKVAAVLAVVFVSVLAVPVSAAPRGPDLIVDGSYTAQTWAVVDETFDPTWCAVQEGAITAGPHKLLRFATRTANIGGHDLRVGKPKANSPNWTFYTCHNHWHFVQYAEYVLRDAAGTLVGVGHKQSFCIEDVQPYYANVAAPRFNCDNQGLSVGWSDIYGAGLDGQWVVVDDVPPGSYQLTITVNYADVLPETNYANNSATIPVTIP